MPLSTKTKLARARDRYRAAVEREQKAELGERRNAATRERVAAHKLVAELAARLRHEENQRSIQNDSPAP